MLIDAPLDDLTDAILSCCDRIPPGMVVAYGDIAAQVGCNPRHVGRIMRTHGHVTCWWRVVRADGTSAVADRAKPLWEAEGIISAAGRVDMASYRFDFDDDGSDFPHFSSAKPSKPAVVEKTPSDGEQVASLHKISGLSIEQLGKLFGVSRRSVHNWMNGHRMANRHQERLSMLISEIRSLPGETPDEKRDALFYSVDKPSRYRELVNNVERPVQLQYPPFSPGAPLS